MRGDLEAKHQVNSMSGSHSEPDDRHSLIATSVSAVETNKLIGELIRDPPRRASLATSICTTEPAARNGVICKK